MTMLYMIQRLDFYIVDITWYILMFVNWWDLTNQLRILQLYVYF